MKYSFYGSAKPFTKSVHFLLKNTKQANQIVLPKKHMMQIFAIAEREHLPLHEVAPVYETILNELMARARIPDYLPVFVSKKVREILRIKQRSI